MIETFRQNGSITAALHEEEQVLGACVVDKDLIDEATAAGVKTGWFSTPYNQRLWFIATRTHDRGEPFNDVTIRQDVGEAEWQESYGCVFDRLIHEQLPSSTTPPAFQFLCDKLREPAMRRVIIGAAEDLFHTATDTSIGLADFDLDYSHLLEEHRGGFNTMTAAELAGGEFETRWLIHDWLVAGQPGMIGGPQKSLKTGLSIELAVSLCTRSHFLGRFPVADRTNVLLMSGESGLSTLQETFKRIAWAHGSNPASIEGLYFSPELPDLTSAGDIAVLRQEIRKKQLGCMIVDPLYLSLPAEAGNDASNLFKMGAYLKPLGKLCQETNCTILLAHHSNARASGHNGTPQLTDLAFSGIK